MPEIATSSLTLLLGIGNEARRDDGVGLAIARRLELSPPPGCRVEVASPDGASLLEHWRGARAVLTFDAAWASGRPGAVLELGPDALGPIHPAATSGHRLGLAEAVALARALGEMPDQFEVLAVVGEDFGYGFGLTAAVEAAVDEVVARVRGRYHVTGAA